MVSLGRRIHPESAHDAAVPVPRWRAARRALVAGTVAVLMVAAAGCSTGSTTAESSTRSMSEQFDSGLEVRLDKAIEDTIGAASLPGAIVGVWGPDGEYVRAFGVADKATHASMETDFYHRIGSLTKTFTVTGVLQLVDEGKVGLDDPISTYVEGVPNGEHITIRQLAQMQSGLADFTSAEFDKVVFADPYVELTPRQLLDFAFAQPATSSPGQGFAYVNTNAILLGLVVENVSGMALSDYVAKRILEPLGMAGTSFPTTNAFPKPHAQGYTNITADREEADATDWNPSWAWAAGAMISTLDDLRIWAPALATGTLLQPETQTQRLETIRVPGFPDDVGAGLGILNNSGWIGHGGSISGYQTQLLYLPEQKITLAILTNTDFASGGNAPSSLLTAAITEVITPEHVFRGSPSTQNSDED
jgi:D-alanyl-D-alanine carboxypeptidase